MDTKIKETSHQATTMARTKSHIGGLVVENIVKVTICKTCARYMACSARV